MAENKPISQVLDELGPRTVEGDQGRYTAHSITDAIKADMYAKSRDAMSSRSKTAGVIRGMNFYLRAPGGRAR